MPVAQTTIDGLTQSLTVTVTKDQYLPEWKKQLSDTQRNVQMKGFRKGKTPMGFVRKMYGQSLLGETINTKIQEELDNYIKDQKLKVLGQPIASAEQEKIDFDIKNLEDYTFKFDVGLSPEIELVDLSTIKVNRTKIEVTDDILQQELEAAQKRMGKQEDADITEENDIIKMNVAELDTDGTLKAEGYNTVMTLLISSLTDDAQKDFVGAKNGDVKTFNVYTIEKDSTKELVQKHLLQIPEDVDADQIGEEFSGTIFEIKRNIPAELNEDFFKNLFNDEKITDEAGAKAKFKEEIENYYLGQANNLMHHQVRTELIAAHKFELPKVFIERWIKMSKEDITQEDLDHQFIHVAEDLSWNIIQGEIVQKSEIEVSEQDIRDGFMAQIASYFGGQMSMDPEMFKSTIDKMMENQEQVRTMYDQALSKKVFDALADQVTIADVSKTADEFKDEVSAFNEQMQQHNH